MRAGTNSMQSQIEEYIMRLMQQQRVQGDADAGRMKGMGTLEKMYADPVGERITGGVSWGNYRPEQREQNNDFYSGNMPIPVSSPLPGYNSREEYLKMLKASEANRDYPGFMGR